MKEKIGIYKKSGYCRILGMASNTDFTESDLENSILSNLQKFLMELGKGYAFWGKTATYSYRKAGLLH